MSRTVLLCAALLMISPGIGAADPGWRAISGPLPPFAYEQQGRPTGFMVDLVDEAARSSGTSLRIDFYPWARAVALAQAGPQTLIFPLARTPERERRFTWVLPLYVQDYVVIAARETAFVEKGLAPSTRVGLIRGTTLARDLPALRGRPVSDERDYSDLFRKLDEGMIDAIVGPVAIVRASMKLIGRDPADYRFGPTLGSFELWVAASIDSRAERLAPLKAQLRAQHRDGRYESLLRLYGLDENFRSDQSPRSGGASRRSPLPPRPSPSAWAASPE